MAQGAVLRTAPKPSQAVDIRLRRREEVRRLKRELEVVKQERDRLKKALGIFSRSPQ